MNCSLRQFISEHVYEHDLNEDPTAVSLSWKWLFLFLLSLDGDTDQQMPTEPHQAQLSLHLLLLTPYTGHVLGPLSKYSFQQCDNKIRDFCCSAWLDVIEIIHLEHRKRVSAFLIKKINGVYSVLPEKTEHTTSVLEWCLLPWNHFWRLMICSV